MTNDITLAPSGADDLLCASGEELAPQLADEHVDDLDLWLILAVVVVTKNMALLTTCPRNS
jgi:hypothetical protein